MHHLHLHQLPVGLAVVLAGLVAAGAPGDRSRRGNPADHGEAARFVQGWRRAAARDPFEAAPFAIASPLDQHLRDALKAAGLRPAALCSDAVFFRRVHIDLTGTLPDGRAVRAFLDDPSPKKRTRVVDRLLRSPEFADYWSLKWGDTLRIKAEFPINLWPNGVQAYHRWIHDAIRDNLPYDRFARELLCASGSNFRVPPVNFYRAIQGQEPATIAAAVALTFMGTRIEQMTPERRDGLEALFSRLTFKGTAEWKEQIICHAPDAAGDLQAILPDGRPVAIPADVDPRAIFAQWLIAPDNPWFARAAVNRTWAWLFGRGLIHEPDDIRPDNPPVHPAMLDYLEREFVAANYDCRHLCRLICTSATYQQSSIPRAEYPEAAASFACYPVRRLDAEVLADALERIGAPGEEFASAIPEPFTFIPAEQRTIALADGSITSQFLETFGRPARDTGRFSERDNQPTKAQRLHLLNSSQVEKGLRRSPLLRGAAKAAGRNPKALIAAIYLNVLSRYPTMAELRTAEAYHRDSGENLHQSVHDLAWALINTKEFLYHH